MDNMKVKPVLFTPWWWAALWVINNSSQITSELVSNQNQIQYLMEELWHDWQLSSALMGVRETRLLDVGALILDWWHQSKMAALISGYLDFIFVQWASSIFI